ncbi:MAG: hypothetical protein ACLSAP_01260 [Oscillospiraceae bacterium]
MQNSPLIQEIIGQIVRIVPVQAIYLFSRKVNLQGETSSFKLCVISDGESKNGVERSIYLGVDCDLPFDVVVYTPAEWERHLQNPHSFAAQVLMKGQKLYG